MKVQVEIVTLFRDSIGKNKQNTVPYELETTNKLTATLEKGNTISIYNINPFKEIEANDYDYLKVMEVGKSSVKFEVNNALSNIVKDGLSACLLNKKLLKLQDKMIIELPINQVLFVDDTIDDVYKTISLRIINISK